MDHQVKPLYPRIEDRKFNSFKDFFPFYMSQHRKRGTRLVHFMGTNLALGFLGFFLITQNFWFLPIGLFSVYGPAFLSHWLIEHNQPATFKHPFYSMAGDLAMWYYMWIGKIY